MEQGQNNTGAGRGGGGTSRRDFVKGIAAGAAAVSAGAVGLSAAPAHAQPQPPSRLVDFDLINGKFVDGRGVVASAISIRDGRIAAVGQADARGAAQSINLRGHTVIPGLIDSHAHFTRTGTNPGYEARHIETAFSIAELQEVVARRAETVPPGGFITCMGGWNQNQLAEGRLPTGAELDGAAPNHGVYLNGRTNGVGAAFFANFGITVDGQGQVSNTGAATTALRSVHTDADTMRGTRDHIAHAASLGVTAVHDVGNTTVQPDDYQYMSRLHEDGGRRLDVRMRFGRYFRGGEGLAELEGYILANHFNRIGDDTLRLQGVGEQIVTSIGDFEDGCRVVARHGWTLHQHVLNAADHNIRIAAVITVGNETDISNLRWNITHVPLITEQQLQDLKSVGAGVSSQDWLYLSGNPGPPFRRMVDSGINVAGGTDSTNVAPFNPFLALFYFSTGRNLAGVLTNDGQQLSRLEALRIYTLGSAWFSFEEEEYGSFELGKVADLAVLTDDYLTVPDDRLRKIRSLLTLQGGRAVHAEGVFSRVQVG